MNLCNFNIFGINPNDNNSVYFTVIDIILTIISTYYITRYAPYGFIFWLILVFIIGIKIQKLLCMHGKGMIVK